eukprot:TRINITY_DN995_c1_g1_i1.p1 TRINITY_DN995_c1_g1~~TRINITY_DN995_c1_g1_i1.p1  ORF type:complete len:820 (+),score=124.90 TRINITY_DN995_c1_g1_i1:221-2461(+)
MPTAVCFLACAYENGDIASTFLVLRTKFTPICGASTKLRNISRNVVKMQNHILSCFLFVILIVTRTSCATESSVHWSEVGYMPTAVCFLACAYENGVVYAAGGDGGGFGYGHPYSMVQSFNISAQTFGYAANMSTSRSFFGFTSAEGELYAVGGQWRPLSSPKILSSVEVFNPQTGKWRDVESMQHARVSFSAVTVANADGSQTIYAVGGDRRTTGKANTIEFYDLKRGRWAIGPTLPAPYDTARDMTAVAIGTIIYIVGGVDDGTDPLANATSFDTVSGTFRTLAPMQVARGSMGLAVLNDMIYAMGGWSNLVASRHVEQYNPQTNTWLHVAPMLFEAEYFGVTSTASTSDAENAIIVMGGSDTARCMNYVQKMTVNSFATETDDAFLEDNSEVQVVSAAAAADSVTAKLNGQFFTTLPTSMVAMSLYTFDPMSGNSSLACDLTQLTTQYGNADIYPYFKDSESDPADPKLWIHLPDKNMLTYINPFTCELSKAMVPLSFEHFPSDWGLVWIDWVYDEVLKKAFVLVADANPDGVPIYLGTVNLTTGLIYNMMDLHHPGVGKWQASCPALNSRTKTCTGVTMSYGDTVSYVLTLDLSSGALNHSVAMNPANNPEAANAVEPFVYDHVHDMYVGILQGNATCDHFIVQYSPTAGLVGVLEHGCIKYGAVLRNSQTLTVGLSADDNLLVEAIAVDAFNYAVLMYSLPSGALMQFVANDEVKAVYWAPLVFVPFANATADDGTQSVLT